MQHLASYNIQNIKILASLFSSAEIFKFLASRLLNLSTVSNSKYFEFENELKFYNLKA